MVILYFLGGQDPFLEKGIAILCRAIREAGENPQILILPWGLDGMEAVSKATQLRSAFKDLGTEAEVAWPDEDVDTLREKVSSSDLVFLADGDARIMRRRMSQSCMSDLMQNYEGVVVGDAMGGAVMCQHVILPPDEYGSSYTVILGLNLVDFGVVPRYRREIDPFMTGSSMGRTVFGIPDGSALMYGAGILSHYGTVYMFKNGKRTTLTDTLPY
ncbi:MAG: type 1 glutamine amidotransferase-like domain-containing protein [Euryarchaeota archaeon]|nr:type 1 glutamine amidotransferase-like domain-containing protein [Euryarchaeota archaeon]